MGRRFVKLDGAAELFVSLHHGAFYAFCVGLSPSVLSYVPVRTGCPVVAVVLSFCLTLGHYCDRESDILVKEVTGTLSN